MSSARELFGANGYDATAIEDVLGAAGVARGALYHHFPSKSALFDAVAEEVFAEVARRTAGAARDGADALERIRLGSHEWLAMALDPAVQRITLLDPITVLGWERWRGLDERHTLGGLRRAFAELESDGRIPEGEGELFANLLLAALNEAALFIASSADSPAALATARGTVDTLLDRLAGAGSAQAPQNRALPGSPTSTASASR